MFRHRVITAALALLLAAPALAQPASGFRPSPTPAEGVPAELQGVDIVEKPGATLPLDVPFIDESGEQVTLRTYFNGSRPVILQIGYLKCPMLCNLVLNELVKGLKGVDWAPGTEFDIVSVSINPLETHELADVKKQGYVMEYGRPDTARGWHFLTGPEPSSRAVADAVGFQFRFQPETGEYAHAAAVMLCTPDGRLSRYLYGVQFKPNDLRMGLLEASDGKIGTSFDRFILWCHVYDPDARGYVLFALRLMKLGGMVTIAILFGGLSMLWLRDLRRGHNRVGAPAPAPAPAPASDFPSSAA